MKVTVGFQFLFPQTNLEIMITTLPTLSYMPTGFVWSEDFHSPPYTTQRAYPRTDLNDFVRWETFETEIHEAITTRMSAMPEPIPLDIGSLPKSARRVVCEETVRKEASQQLHDLVEEVLNILGIKGWFSTPCSGNNQIVGEPDFSWLRGSTLHPKVVVRHGVSIISVLTGPASSLWDR